MSPERQTKRNHAPTRSIAVVGKGSHTRFYFNNNSLWPWTERNSFAAKSKASWEMLDSRTTVRLNNNLTHDRASCIFKFKSSQVASSEHSSILSLLHEWIIAEAPLCARKQHMITGFAESAHESHWIQWDRPWGTSMEMDSVLNMEIKRAQTANGATALPIVNTFKLCWF